MEKPDAKILSVVDESRWPILVVTPPTEYSEEMHRQYLAYLGWIYETRSGPYCLIIDARNTPRPAPLQRKVETEFRNEYAAHVKQHCRGTAFVMSSKVMAGVLTAMFWIKKPDTEIKSFSDFDEALTWAKGRVR
jgi:hypothetical protein